MLFFRARLFTYLISSVSAVASLYAIGNRYHCFSISPVLGIFGIFVNKPRNLIGSEIAFSLVFSFWTRSLITLLKFQ